MNASKENGRKAIEYLDQIWEDPDKESSKEKCDFIEQFLEAAIRKLPSEASYAKKIKFENGVAKSKRSAQT